MSTQTSDHTIEKAFGENKPIDIEVGNEAKRVLILPDIHHRIKIAQSIIDYEKADHIIHLGDHQDNFNDTAYQAMATAKWTRDRLEAGDTVLLGNHDLPYWFPNKLHTWGCGWTEEKHRAIQGIITPALRREFKLWTLCQGWLFSHAGFTSMYYNTELIEYGHDVFLEETLWSGNTHPLIYHVGETRGGRGKGGGILWLDWYDFMPLVIQKQIVGHTPCRTPLSWERSIYSDRTLEGGKDWNLDTHLKHYGILENGKLTVKKVNAF